MFELPVTFNVFGSAGSGRSPTGINPNTAARPAAKQRRGRPGDGWGSRGVSLQMARTVIKYLHQPSGRKVWGDNVLLGADRIGMAAGAVAGAMSGFDACRSTGR